MVVRSVFLAAASVAFISSPSNGFVLPKGTSSCSRSTDTAAANSVSGVKAQTQSSTDDLVTDTATTTTSTVTSSKKTKSKSPVFEYLKFDGKPTFDVLAKTKEYIETIQKNSPPGSYEHLFDDDYVLRGPVIGPINRADLAASQKGLDLANAFPNIEMDTFGYTIDPENPYRCFYFQRWRATHVNDMDSYGDVYPATGLEAETPVSVFSVVWTPQEKIIYEQVGAVVDRFEGNTEGKAAVFGLLHTAGLKLNANPGDVVFGFLQRLGHVLGGRGRSWSRKGDIPEWWISKSKGADKTDQW